MNGSLGRLADHNRKLGQIVLTSDYLRHDLPLGSDIEVTISAREPGALKVEAYVPRIDEVFSARIEMDRRACESESELRDGFEKEKGRIHRVIRKANAEGSPEEDEIARKVDAVNELWVRAGEVEGAQQLQTRIIELRMKLDELDERSKVPEKIEYVEETFRQIECYSSKLTSSQRSELASLKERLDRQRTKKNVAELEKLKFEGDELWRDVMHSQPEHWKGLLAYEYRHRDEMSDQGEANRLFDQGARAIKMEDLEQMRKCALRLLRLLPREIQEDVNRGNIGEEAGGLTVD